VPLNSENEDCRVPCSRAVRRPFGAKQTAGFACGLAFGISTGAGAPPLTAANPRTPIRNDLAADLTFGLAIGFAVGLPAALVFGVAFAAAVAIGFGLASALAGGLTFGLTGASGLGGGLTGGLSGMRYTAFSIVVLLRRRLPFRIGSHLDWIRESGLLRVSGIAYQLRHRELQVWLAAHPHPR
jgi:hypothetical protein